MSTIQLGLFGAGIGKSRASRLHEIAGRLCGLRVNYTLFDLDRLGADAFETELRRRSEEGFCGVNVTHPVKEQAAKLVPIPDKIIRRLGAINTVRFSDNTGYNTDYTGFIKAFRERFGTAHPGRVLMLGAGGVGKAVAFALAALGPGAQIDLVDKDESKARALATELRAEGVVCRVHPVAHLADLWEVDGLVNCTPLGMHQYPGSAMPLELIGPQRWAFDAVYTPIETPFVQTARAKGLEVLTGYELFFHQGVDAFKLFTGCDVNEKRLRRELAAVL